MLAANRAPGRDRRFAFEKLRGHDERLWQNVLEEARRAERPLAPALLWGSDQSSAALAATSTHIEKLGGEAWRQAINLRTQPVETLAAPAMPGLLLSNPPYGERLDELEHLRAWYPVLGAWMKRSLPGWTACFITADPAFPRGVGFKPKRKTPLYNGALECRLYEFEMYAGSQRVAAASN
jgi:Predicted N6-adenine-specific DNA methylase